MGLVNGDFSKEWSGSHDVWVFRQGEPPSLQQVGNIFTPDSWIAWFIHEPGIWDQPEITDAWEHVDPRRVRSAPKALKLFTFGRNHDAGLFQTVDVKVGSRAKFSAYGQAWSNHKDKSNPENFPHPDDGKWSEGSLVGYKEVSLRKGDIPPLNGNPQNDANGNIKFQLGIDPTGGNDPRRDCVVWGEPIWSYNAYHEIPPVETIAQAPTITVFLRSTTLWAFKHNDVYWDDCFLSVTTQEPECENPARIPYDRTYVLLPPDVTKQEAHDAVDKYFDARRTIGYSADDAGIGCNLGERKVIAVHPDAWPSDLRTFFDTYYPGVVYETEGETPPSEILLYQKDPQWRNTGFGSASCNLTIGQAGCFITCLAMALRYYKKEPLATPVTVDQTLTPSGYTSCRPYWSWIENKLGLELSSPINVDTWLDQGYCAMAEVKPVTLEHFVLVTRREETAYWMLDPLTGEEGWLDEAYDGVDSWRLILPANGPPTPPEPPNPEEPTTLLIGLHDEPGGIWMKQNNVKGCCLVHTIVQREPRQLDFTHLQEAGITVLCRLNWNYSQPYGDGCFPSPPYLPKHIEALAGTILNSRGVDYWTIGNEPNNPREQPDEYPFDAQYCVDIYNEVYQRVSKRAALAPPALDPYFGPGSNNGYWWQYFMAHIIGAEALFLHTGKTQTNDSSLVWSEQMFTDDPLQWQYTNVLAIKPYLEMVHKHLYHVPVFLTECNPQYKHEIGGELGWLPDNSSWIHELCSFARTWNQVNVQQIKGVCFFRYQYSGEGDFSLEDKPNILNAIMREAGHY